MPRPDSRHDAPTAIVAEDEPMLADELVENLGALWPRLQVVARATDGVAALHAVAGLMEYTSVKVAFLPYDSQQCARKLWGSTASGCSFGL